jgi:two-component sensor histidine kinase
MDDFRFSIDVPVRNQWDNVERLRQSVQHCLTSVFTDMDGVDALAMVTGELLENAIKYGCWRDEGGVFRLRLWGDRHGATVAVENPVADEEGPARVESTLRFLAGFADSQAAYQARLLEVAAAPRGTSGGLGLVRVAYEGGCRLRADRDGQTLRVTAELVFGEPPA